MGVVGLALQLQTCWNQSVPLKKKSFHNFQKCGFFHRLQFSKQMPKNKQSRSEHRYCFLHHKDLFVKIIIFPHLALLMGVDFSFTRITYAIC